MPLKTNNHHYKSKRFLEEKSQLITRKVLPFFMERSLLFKSSDPTMKKSKILMNHIRIWKVLPVKFRKQAKKGKAQLLILIRLSQQVPSFQDPIAILESNQDLISQKKTNLTPIYYMSGANSMKITSYVVTHQKQKAL